MTEQESREKIARIIAKHLCKNRYSHFQLYGDSANCYSRENFAECEAVCNAVDDLIAAGIGDVETVQKIATSATAMAVLEAAQAEHRAEVAERAVYNLAYGEWQREGARRAICEKYAPSTARDYLDRAEKELAEERKDD